MEKIMQEFDADQIVRQAENGDVIKGDFIPDLSNLVEARAIKAEFIRQLFLGGPAGRKVEISPAGIVLSHWKIEGELNLDGLDLTRFPLRLQSCYAGHGIALRHAKIRRLSISECYLPGVDAQGSEVLGEVALHDLTVLPGTDKPYIDFREAKIGGAFRLGEEHNPFICNPDKTLRLLLDNARISTNLEVFCEPRDDEDCRGNLIISMDSAQIDGGVDFTSSTLRSVSARNAEVKGDFILRGCLLSGESLPEGQDAFSGRGLQVGGYFQAYRYKRHSFRCCGKLDIRNARVKGDINLRGSTLGSEEGTRAETVLDATHVNVGGDLRLDAYYDNDESRVLTRAYGEISAPQANIVGELSMKGAIVDTTRNTAIDFAMSSIGSGVSFHADFNDIDRQTVIPGLEVKRGRVRFIGCEIGTKFDAGGAKLTASPRGRWPYIALDLRESQITGTLFLGESQEIANSRGVVSDSVFPEQVPAFSCTGSVVLRNSNIAGDIDLRQSEIKHYSIVPSLSRTRNALPRTQISAITAVSAEGLQLGASLRMNSRENEPTHLVGRLNFDRATIKGDVDFTYTKINCAGQVHDPEQIALLLRNAEVNGDLLIENELDENGRHRDLLNGWFHFSGASFRTIRDNDGVGWGKESACGAKSEILGAALRLDGCSYQRFEDSTPTPPPSQPWRWALISLLALVILFLFIPFGDKDFNFRILSGISFWNIPGIPVAFFESKLGIYEWPIILSLVIIVLSFAWLRYLFQPRVDEPWLIRKHWLRRQVPPAGWKLPHMAGATHGKALRQIDRLRLGFFPGTYQQVARVFEDSGLLHDARQIAQIERRLVDSVAPNSVSKFFQTFVWGVGFGHGYSPARATLTLFLFISIGMLYTQHLMKAGWMYARPSDSIARSEPHHETCATGWRGIGAAPYTFDLVLRKLSLGLANNCAVQIPIPKEESLNRKQPWPFHWIPRNQRFSPGGVYAVLTFMKGAYSILGLVIITLVIITWSGVVRRIRPTQGLRG
jgi:hypothetical protein